ncbi:AAA family ATPase [Natronobiforma cellulositropha]|uniref:AAA family ATPase n=1 Tax=Natronobiforma cellulositropha TaxID=1679076 RepID=UPI0021D5BCF2|nr:MoxR family ATPase [Natronobiforma cellulositropha]
MTDDDSTHDDGRTRTGADGPRAIYDAIEAEVSQVLIGNTDALEHLTISLLTRGHLLLEGVPGVAKTTLATLFARASGLEHGRIQMTPDILPADITGTHVYHAETGSFTLQRGPIFADVVVADEINRATPKTQSALLEAMQERHVTIEGETLALPTPFMVVATQNPIEMEGVFELPEAQRDRFQFKLTIDVPAREDERELIERFDENPELAPDDVEQVVGRDAILAARETVKGVHVAPPLKEYILDVVAATREHPDLVHGASPRATLAFLDGAKARAAIRGRKYVIPDDVKALAEPILAHRLVLSTEADLSSVGADDIVAEVLENIEPPGAETSAGDATAVSDGGGETRR